MFIHSPPRICSRENKRQGKVCSDFRPACQKFAAPTIIQNILFCIIIAIFFYLCSFLNYSVKSAENYFVYFLITLIIAKLKTQIVNVALKFAALLISFFIPIISVQSFCCLIISTAYIADSDYFNLLFIYSRNFFDI